MKALILGLALAALGCAVQPPVTTSSSSSYSLQAVPDASAIVSQLPTRLSLGDAKRLLVQIDPKDVSGGTYTVQATGSARMSGNRDGGNRGDGRAQSFNREDRQDRRDDRRDRRDGRRDGFGGYGFGYDNTLYNTSLVGYYPYGNYYFPYYNYGSYYAPYAANCTLPYLYRFQAYYNPYSIYYGNGAGGPCTTTLDVAPAI